MKKKTVKHLQAVPQNDAQLLNLALQQNDVATLNQLALKMAEKKSLELTELFVAAERLTLADQRDAAIALYRCWLQNTNSPLAYAAWFNMGVLLSETADHPASEAAYRKAIELNPNFIEARLNLGSQCERMGRIDEALDTWRGIVDSGKHTSPADTPKLIHALNHLGRVLEHNKRLHEAELMLERSIVLDPDQPDAIQHWVHLRQKQCAWPVYTRLPGLTDELMLKGTSALAALSAFEDPAQQLAVARSFVERKVKPLGEVLCNPQGYRHDRLRIGYLSSDFCNHPVSILTVELYELHDRNKVEVYGFCTSPEDTSPLRARVIQALDHYVSIKEMTDAEAAQCIRAHEIDILVDLNGLTSGTRPDILSYKPAPVQVTYLGYPGTTALPAVDYVIVDKFLLPEELARFFSEKPLYMPHCFQINDRRRAVGATPTRADCGLPEQAFVFCSFNNNYKFTSEVFAAWMRILQRVPDSVLWLLADNEWARANLCRSAEQHGVDPQRLIFAPRVLPLEYLARFRCADLFLDTYPFNAGTTASDALWAGLPLLTYTGRTFSSRMAGSILTAIGLPELITDNLADYEEKAVSLANDRARVGALKSHIEQHRDTCTLFDSPRFVKDLEDHFERIAVRNGVAAPMDQQAANEAGSAAILTAPWERGHLDRSADRTPALPADPAPALVSVLMPIRQDAAFFEQGLQSVLAQTHDPLEIVIVDGSADDDFAHKLAPYLQKDSRIKYCRDSALSGTEMLARCLELSSGEYVNYWLDGDVFHPDKIQRMLHCMQERPNIGLVTSFRQYIDQDGKPLGAVQIDRVFAQDTAIGGISMGEFLLKNGLNLIGPASAVLLKKADIQPAYGWFAGRQYAGLADVATWLSVLAGKDCVYLAEPLSFRLHAAADSEAAQPAEWLQLIGAALSGDAFLLQRSDIQQALALQIERLQAV
ncbi:MAG: glycosyltransferase [Methylococcaceae bacterium]|nr:MAG: glycosyltransferase [Methylococcaceae bacterium]